MQYITLDEVDLAEERKKPKPTYVSSLLDEDLKKESFKSSESTKIVLIGTTKICVG